MKRSGSKLLKSNLTQAKEDDPTIALPEINGFTIVKVKDIVRCEGERNYSRIFFDNGTSVLVSRTLLDFDNLLVAHGFFRIHAFAFDKFEECEPLSENRWWPGRNAGQNTIARFS